MKEGKLYRIIVTTSVIWMLVLFLIGCLYHTILYIKKGLIVWPIKQMKSLLFGPDSSETPVILPNEARL